MRFDAEPVFGNGNLTPHERERPTENNRDGRRRDRFAIDE